MSAFNPTALYGAPDQKRALLDRLMQQYQQAASRAAGLQGGAATPQVGGVSVARSHPFGGVGFLASPVANMSPQLRAQLGPGSIGTPGNAPAAPPGLGSNPHAGSPLSAGGPPGQANAPGGSLIPSSAVSNMPGALPTGPISLLPGGATRGVPGPLSAPSMLQPLIQPRGFSGL